MKQPQMNCSPAPLWGTVASMTLFVPTAAHKGRGLRTVVVALLFWLTTASAQITLNGNLLTDAEKPVPNTKVSVATGPFNTTDSKGQFSLKLSLDFIEGERVILIVHKKDWVINYPLDGEWNLPAKKLQEVPTQYTKVVIVPFGSKALWSHARIEKHIGLLSDEIAKLKKEGDTPKPIDFKYYLNEWANKYGFTPQQVKTAFDQWSAEAANSEDYRTLGLRAFYEKNFAAAAENFEKAAKQGETRLKALREETRQVTLGTYANWKDAGNMLSNLYRFSEALAKYDSASRLVSKVDYPSEWAEIRIFIGNTKGDIGTRTEGDKANIFLKESEQAYREAFEVYTREQLPQYWAGTQNNLGTVLSDLGTRTGGEEGAKLLKASVTAYENALVVYTREQLPQDWAMTQNNLGTVLSDLGTRTGGEEGAKLLSQAVEAYRLALVVRTREQLPQQWAATQNNLGGVLQMQGTRTGGEEGAKLLSQAVEAYRLALVVRTREQLPQDWAMTQNNLGAALEEQGIRTGGEEGAKLLSQAMEAYRLALVVRTREQLPQDWAMTQNNLGIALKNQGIRTGGEEGAKLLSQAVEAYRLALLVRTREQLPQQWATTQNNLGLVLQEQGIRAGGEAGAKLLSQAVEAYRLALVVYTREQLPQDWAMTQNNLGSALQEQGTRTGGEAGAKLLSQAVEAYRLALVVYTREQLPQDWAMTQNNLGNALQEQGTRAGGEEGAKLLSQAVEAYRLALLVRTREQLPQYWAETQNNLGAALQEQGTRTGGEAGAKLLSHAVEAFKRSLEVRNFAYLPEDWAQSQNNLAETYTYLEDWPNVAACYANVLKVYPDYEKAYQTASYFYHEVLHAHPTDYTSAFTLNQNWLARHPEDLSAQCDFAEKHFTTSRFAECQARLTALLANAEIKPSTQIALRTIQIANAIGLNQTAKIPAHLETLQQAIVSQPDTFKVDWTFEGTKHFISQNEKLASYRPWLLQLFAAIEGENRAAILAGLRETRASFQTVGK